MFIVIYNRPTHRPTQNQLSDSSRVHTVITWNIYIYIPSIVGQASISGYVYIYGICTWFKIDHGI